MYGHKFDILREAAELSHPGFGTWLFDTWAHHNNRYFGDKLDVIPLIWGLTPHGHALGFYDPEFKRIVLHTSLLNPSGDAWGIARILGQRFAGDVLLHEMMHQHIHQRDGGHPHGHNHPQWADEINRVARLVGLPDNAQPIKQKRVKVEGAKGKGKVMWVAEPDMMTWREMASWPQSTRPHGYYESDALPLLDKLPNT